MKRDKQSEESWAVRADEVRRLLGGIGRNTLYDWVRENKIPYKRVGGVILFSRRQLQEWLESSNNNRGA